MMKEIFPSAARTATTTSDPIYRKDDFEAMHIVIIFTVLATITVTPKIQAQDVFGNWYDLLTGAAAAAPGTVVLKVGPSITPAANLAISDFVPDVFRIVMTHSGATSTTYSVALNGGCA